MERVIPRSDESNSQGCFGAWESGGEARRQGELGSNRRLGGRWRFSLRIKGDWGQATGATLVTLATLHEVAIDVIVSL